MARTNLRHVLHRAIVVLGAGMILACLAAYISFYSIDGPSFQQGRERASDLIAALEQYRQDWGRYPSDMHLLVPDYLSTIPRPAWRYKYGYRTYSSDRYEVDFKLRGDADDWGCYSSETEEWQRYDSYCQ